MLKKLSYISSLNLKNYDFADEIDDYIGRVVEKYSPAIIIIFGSLTRGDYWHDSDADIIVVLKKALVNPVDKGIEVRKLGYEFPLDLFVYGEEQFVNMLNQGNLLALDAMEYGKILYIGDEKYSEHIDKLWNKIRRIWQPTDWGWRAIE